MELEFIPIDYDSFDFQGKNVIRLIGRTNKNKRVCIIDSYDPNFFLILKDEHKDKAEALAKKISTTKVSKQSRESTITKTKIVQKKFLGKTVTAIQVFVTNHKDAHDIASEIGEHEEILCRREYDIPLMTKYIKEKKVEPLVWYKVKASPTAAEDFGGIAESLEVEHCFAAETMTPFKEQKKFTPRTLAYDIETDSFDAGKGNILMIALYGENFKKVITHKAVTKPQGYVEIVKNQKEMLQRFVEHVKAYDPDVLTGYFSDGFDLPFIREVAKRTKTKLTLGLDGKEPNFSKGKIPAAKIAGIVHVDAFRFISYVFSQYLTSETLSLNDVATELIGEQKEEFDFSLLNKKMSEADWKKFYSYNLQDTKVTFELFNKIWPDMFEFVSIIKEPLFQTSRNSMSTHVENYLLHNLDHFDEIAEKKPLGDQIAQRRATPKFEGAFVFEPTPGLYENVAMFDFTSMYSSVIISYNLSKSTLREDGSFSKQKGFFPTLLEEILARRKKHKAEYAKNQNNLLRARSNAYKLLANASYGYQAFFGARYYSYEAAQATAKFARENIHTAIKDIEKAGYEVIYSDTDSIAFLQGKKTKKEIEKFLDALNKKLPGVMELDLEDFYKRAIFVHARASQKGAKKKYAMIDSKNKVKIRGFETVRRDWCKLARKLQSKIITEILKTGKPETALTILKKTVAELKKGSIPKEDLIIKTKLKKPLKDYQAKGPHVIAAEKMRETGQNVNQGSMIEYYIAKTTTKKKKISDGVALPKEEKPYDTDYYLENQITPAVENIFDVFEINITETIQGKKQTNLMDF